MKPPTDNDRLLDDVLAESAPAGFRGALLGETLHRARRRRHWRQTRRATAVLAVMSVLAILVWRNLPQPSSAPKPLIEAGSKSYQLVLTRSLPPQATVSTQPLAAGKIIASVANVNILQTAALPGDYREIGDNDLLALVAPRPAVLVGCGPYCEQLIFLNPEDERGFPVN
jgi:hypothetical protein